VSRIAHAINTMSDTVTPSRTRGESQAGIRSTTEQEGNHGEFVNEFARHEQDSSLRKTDACRASVSRRED
jgi:hypothetical protein